MRRPTFRRPPAARRGPDASAARLGATIARFAFMGAAAVGVGFLLGALSSDPASADTAAVPSVGADERKLERIRATSPIDDLITGLVERPEARHPGAGRSATRASPDAGRQDDQRGAGRGTARSGRPAGDRPAAPPARNSRGPAPNGPSADPSPGNRASADRSLTDRSPADRPLTGRPPDDRPVAARSLEDRSAADPASVGRALAASPARSTVPIVGARTPAPAEGTDLPEVTRAATGLASLPTTALAALPTTSADPLLTAGLAALPATEAVIGRTEAVVRPVLVTVVAAVSSGVATVTTPVTQLPELVTPRLRVLPGRSAGGLYTVGGSTSWTSTTDPVAGVTPPARPLAPDPPPAAAPRAAPPGEVASDATVAGVTVGWHRPSTGMSGAGPGSTPAPTGLPQRPHPPGGDGVAGADGGPGPLRAMIFDGCQVPATASTRADVRSPRRHAGRFPGVAARPG
ncbi:hypothetical protein KBX50_01560 [Micromonospora sp. C51]|uniref:hypothetical protein n=1 Tax=Micromonospora sp. C51 TaxID=2824879 RepID=UPI001B36EA8F|nr:hypothetical protein [Micromonospora sp. C51]MBQ1047167.1 hypothetical protein [Micromonospora sp. C51]